MRFAGRAPAVIAGPDEVRQGPPLACVACGCSTVLLVPDGELVLCLDAVECAKRYRRGVSAESYAAELRGEILTAASL